MDPEDADYVCRLTDDSLQKAIKELNEDPIQRLGAIQTLRKWIREQKHYNCPTDTQFILDHLRKAKFSQLEARKHIDNYMTVRTSHPEYMTNIDIQDPIMMAYLENGLYLPLPKPDKEGRTIILSRADKVDFDNPIFNTVAETRWGLAVNEMIRVADENFSVNGMLLIIDWTGFGFKYLNSSTSEQRRIKAKILQECTTMRIKGIFFYNSGTMFEIVMTVMKAFVKKKLVDRIQMYDSMESLYKVIPMELWPTEYLPDDYKGPSAGSIGDIIADLKKQMMDPELRNRILAKTSDKYKIDETKRPRDVVSQQSFRKLNID